MAPMKAPTHRDQDDTFDPSWTLTHVAHRWGVSRRDVRELLRDGTLPFVEIEGQLRVPIQAVYQYELGVPPMVE